MLNVQTTKHYDILLLRYLHVDGDNIVGGVDTFTICMLLEMSSLLLHCSLNLSDVSDVKLFHHTFVTDVHAC